MPSIPQLDREAYRRALQKRADARGMQRTLNVPLEVAEVGTAFDKQVTGKGVTGGARVRQPKPRRGRSIKEQVSKEIVRDDALKKTAIQDAQAEQQRGQMERKKNARDLTGNQKRMIAKMRQQGFTKEETAREKQENLLREEEALTGEGLLEGLYDLQRFADKQRKKKKGGGKKSLKKSIDKQDESIGMRMRTLGEDQGKEIMEADDEVKEFVGKGFGEDFLRGFLMPFKAIGKLAKPILKAIPTPATQVAAAGLDLVGLGVTGGGEMTCKQESSDDEMEGGGVTGGAYNQRIVGGALGSRAVGSGKKKRATSGNDSKRKRRATLVSKVMKEQGLSLGEASKQVKEKGLSY